MTVADLQTALSDFPATRPVAVFFDGQAVVTDRTGDRVAGHLSAYLDIAAVTGGHEVSAGGTLLPLTVLSAKEIY